MKIGAGFKGLNVSKKSFHFSQLGIHIIFGLQWSKTELAKPDSEIPNLEKEVSNSRKHLCSSNPEFSNLLHKITAAILWVLL